MSDKVPPAPRHLSDLAKVEWKRLAPIAVRQGSLTIADGRAFELLCETLATEKRCRELVLVEGVSTRTADGGQKPHPAVRPMETARLQAARLLEKFGLTPSGRKGMVPLGDGSSDSDWSDLIDG